MEWNPEVTLGDLATAAGLFLTFIGLLFAGFQFRQNSAEQRARYLLELHKLYFGDEAIRQLFYKIDGNQFRIDDKFWGSEDERSLDGLLYTLDVIGCFVRLRAVTMHEVDLLAFQAHQVLNHGDVKNYLAWLDSAYQAQGINIPAHDDARFLAQELRCHCGKHKRIHAHPSEYRVVTEGKA